MSDGVPPVVLWLGPALAPLLALALLPLRRWRWLVPMGALPALGVALFASLGTVDLPWLFLGARFGLDETGRIFLLFSSALWLAAGVHGGSYLHDDPRRGSFFAFFCAAMAGNFGLVLAQDAVSFYVFFALMSFASYGLVVHTRTAQALFAGQIYIALVIVGELALFAAIALAVQTAGSVYFVDIAPALAESSRRDAVIALTLIGFGIKAGALPLHVWLPLAHPAAPTPASAVLSGAMIKAGLLGWLRFLPLGAAAPLWGEALITLGLLAAFAGALVGATQGNAKAALAYSSISQMGFITVAVGVALVVPAAAPAAMLAAALYAFHHAFAKAALFLGVSLSGTLAPAARLAWALGMALSALALAGAPLTSGAAAKTALKDVLAFTGWTWLPPLVSLAAAGTVLVMLRTLWLLRRPDSASVHAPRPGMWVGWALLVTGSVAGYELVAAEGTRLPLTASAWFAALWPIGLGALLAALLVTGRRVLPGCSVPPGDLLLPLLAALRGLRPAPRAGHHEHGEPQPLATPSDAAAGWPVLARAEAALSRHAGLAVMATAATALLLLGL